MKLKTISAIAFAMVLGSGMAHASTLAATPAVYSQQGQALSGVAAAQGLPALVVTLGADYSVLDDITLRIAGATVGGATNTNLAVAANIACSGGPDMIVSFITRTGNDILLRVTQKNVLNTVGVSCTVAANSIEVTAASLSVLTTVTAGWNARTAISNIPFDPVISPVGGLATLANVIDQFRTTPAPTLLNGIVDVNVPSLRTLFLTDDGGALPGNEDTFVLSTLNDSGVITAGPIATLGSVTATLFGDFSHFDTNNNGCVAGEIGNAWFLPVPTSGTFTRNIAVNCQSITYVWTPGAPGTVGHSFTFGTTGKAISAPQSFTSTVMYSYTGIIPGTFTESDGPVSIGGWTLNGFSAFVPYMPYGTGISQIIYLSNKSAQTGAVTVSGYNQSGVACNFSAGSVMGNRVTQMSGQIKAGFEGCYGPDFNDRISFNITANIPGALAEVVSAYNVNGDRVQVINNSNGKAGGTFSFGAATYTPTLGGSL